MARIFLATQPLLIEPAAPDSPGVVRGPNNTWGLSTSFTLEATFDVGQLEVYEASAHEKGKDRAW